MAWLWVVLVVVVLGLTAAVAVGRGGSLERAYPDRRDVRLPAGRPVNADDLEDVEFSVVFRGYRMDEVDAVIERLAHELAVRDARLAELEPPAARPVGPRFDPIDHWAVRTDASPATAEVEDAPPRRSGQPSASALYDQYQDERVDHPAPRTHPQPGAGDP